MWEWLRKSFQSTDKDIEDARAKLARKKAAEAAELRESRFSEQDIERIQAGRFGVNPLKKRGRRRGA